MKIYLVILIILGIAFVSSSLTGFFFADNRQEYCLEDKCVNKSVFSKLPSFPKDFSNNCDREDCWKQPEFYPNFRSEALPYYTNPPSGYLGYIGYGAFPAEEIISASQEERIQRNIYFHASWYVINFQGLKLEASYDKDYFDVKINPDVLLLAPTYPFFDYNWTQKVLVNMKVKNPPPGIYYIDIDVAEPPQDISDRWANEYPGGYVPAGIFSIGRPFYRLQVRVR